MERFGTALTESLDEGRTMALDPATLDYSLIDPPLRSLVRSINDSPWAMTLGCCAGRACHEFGNFYVRVAVRGLGGVRRFSRWLSLARTAGWEECIASPSVSAFALPDAEILTPSTATPEGEWVTFDLLFHLGGSQPGGDETSAGIRALELGWEALKKGNS
jgi:hypothetical protein